MLNPTMRDRERAERDAELAETLGVGVGELPAVGLDIRRRRSAIGLTATGLAQRAGLPSAQVSHIEQGRCSSAARLRRVLEALAQAEAAPPAPGPCGPSPFNPTVEIRRRQRKGASVRARLAQVIEAVSALQDGRERHAECGGGPIARGRVHAPRCDGAGCGCPPVRFGRCGRCGAVVE